MQPPVLPSSGSADKKAVVLALPALILLFSGLWAAQGVDSIPITRHEVSKDVVLYQVGQTGVFSNMTAVRTSAGAVVFDSLLQPELAKRVRGMIEKDFGGKIACLINTHGAPDHTGGNSAFKDVPIYGHEAIKAELEQMAKMMAGQGNNAPPALDSEAGKKLMAQMRDRRAAHIEKVKGIFPIVLKEEEDSSLMNNVFGQFKKQPDPLVPPTLIGESYDLAIADKTFHILHNTPSYSDSDIVIFIPEAETLIVGDIFNAGRLPTFSRQGTDLDAWAKLFAPFLADNSGVKHFIGTHGSGIITAAEIKEQFQYLAKLSQEVASLKAAGKSVAEIKTSLPLDRFPHLAKYNPYFYGSEFNLHEMNITTLWNLKK